MAAVRIAVGVLAALGVLGVLSSVLRTVVLPRAVPARLARLVFLSVRGVLRLRLRMMRDRGYGSRDRVFALQAPLGLFAQLTTWGVMIMLLFAAIFWATTGGTFTGTSISRAIEVSGSSMLTLGIDKPQGLGRKLLGFTDAGVGLALLALVITYLPSLYTSFSRREALITKLTVRAGRRANAADLLRRTWELGRFADIEEVWDAWEDWFVELGESHTTFPQLGFFRSPHPENHWVLASETVLDAAALCLSACKVPRQSRGELCLKAGVHALIQIAEFLGIEHEVPDEGPPAAARLPEAAFHAAVTELREAGIPVVDDAAAAWDGFARRRARYEPLLVVLGRMTDAPRSSWSSWSEDGPRHSPPLLRIHRRS